MEKPIRYACLDTVILDWASIVWHWTNSSFIIKQKQTYRGVFKKRCSENRQQIYRRTPMPECDFNKLLCNIIEITLQHECSPVNLLHIFIIPFYRNTSGWLLLIKSPSCWGKGVRIKNYQSLRLFSIITLRKTRLVKLLFKKNPKNDIIFQSFS